jgi:hypothetical protein
LQTGHFFFTIESYLEPLTRGWESRHAFWRKATTPYPYPGRLA